MFNTIKELKSTKHEVTIKIDEESLKTLRKMTLQTAAGIAALVIIGHVDLVLKDRKNHTI